MATPPSTTTRTSETSWLGAVRLVLLLGVGVGCALPWMTSTGTSLTANVYDLAEWLSLHPTVRNTSRFLFPAFALRLVMVVVFLLALSLVLWEGQRVVPVLMAIVLWLGMLPPVAFFQGDFTDANYLQQAVLWGVTTVLGFALWWLPQRYQALAQAVFTLIAVGGGGWGLWTALDLMGRYEIPVQMGVGFMVFGGCMLGQLGVLLWDESR